MKDDLISRKAAIEYLDKRRTYELMDGKNRAYGKGVRDAMKDIENQPSVQAVPLDRLCEWLAEHYGSPCQLAEIDCYPQCEPDENGECYGMRTDNKRCWHDYLTKWMEAQNA